MKTICLTMIVRNSGEILRETLQSVLPYVTSYCICDTGSTDNTMEIIKEECKNKRGILFEEEFIDFSYNRNRVLEEAEKHLPSDYYFMLDDSFILHYPEELVNYLENNDKLYYATLIKNEDTTYLSGRITTTGLRYKYAIHEIVYTDIIPEIVPKCYIHEKRPEEHSERTSKRRDFDLLHLEKDNEKYPNDPRVMYYYARTLYHSGEYEKSSELFKKRLTCPESMFTYEVYNSMLYLTLLQERNEEKSMVPISELYKSIHQAFPKHAEPLFFAALAHRRKSEHKQAIECLEKAVEIKMDQSIGVKFLIYEEYIPKMLANYYFKTNMEECIRLILHYYIIPKKPFDFMYESYIRHIFRICPTHPSTHDIVVYHKDGKYNSTYSDKTYDDYIKEISNYEIKDLIVCEEAELIPYFPNIKRIHYLIEGNDLSGMIELFPMLHTIICKDDDHKKYLLENLFFENKYIQYMTKKEFILYKF